MQMCAIIIAVGAECWVLTLDAILHCLGPSPSLIALASLVFLQHFNLQGVTFDTKYTVTNTRSLHVYENVR